MIYTAYGCLVEGRAVCAGYAKAFKLLLGRCGISCYYVVGEAGGGKHGWNCVELDGNYHIYHQYVVRVGNGMHDDLMAFLEDRGITTRVYYPLPLHLQRCFAFLGGKRGDCPEAEKLSEEALALPIFPGLRSDEQERLTDALCEFFA